MASLFAQKIAFCSEKIGLKAEISSTYQDTDRPWTAPDIRGIKHPRMVQGECVSVYVPAGEEGFPVLWFRYITGKDLFLLKGNTDELRAPLSQVTGMTEVKADWFCRQLFLKLSSCIGKKDWEKLTGRNAAADLVYAGKKCSYQEKTETIRITAEMLGMGM